MRWIRRPEKPGIRIQLTLWYTVISALLLLLFGVIFYTTLQVSLANSFDTALQMRSQQVAEGISNRSGKIVVENMVHELPELAATAALIDSFDGTDASQLVDPDQSAASQSQALATHAVVRVLDTSGKTIYASPAFNHLALPASSMTQPLKGVPWYGTVTGPDGQPVRLYSTMLMDKQTVVGVVQVGQSMTALNTRLQHIALALFLFTPFALLLSAYGSYLLAGRAFRPVHRLMRIAREIGAKDLHQRVPVPVAHDEVRDLALIFNQMIGRLERAFSQQRRFVADASHELRTPVTVIRNMTEVALSQPSSSEDYETVLSEVKTESERLGKLINDLLALARADEGQVRFDHDEVRLDLLAADVVDSLEPLAQERHITLCAKPLQPVTVMGDAARLIQVIISLVDNALTYTNQGGSVLLSVGIQESNALLMVKDTGIGIGEKDIPHIFERFYRADPARSRVDGGSGLGLAIVDWIVRLHGGWVSVESTPGHGSVFTVALPVVKA